MDWRPQLSFGRVARFISSSMQRQIEPQVMPPTGTKADGGLSVLRNQLTRLANSKTASRQGAKSFAIHALRLGAFARVGGLGAVLWYPI